MSTHHHNETIPPAAVIGAAVLIGLTIVGAAVGRAQHLQAPKAVAAAAPAARSVDLRFYDQTDGSVAIKRPDGSMVEVLAPGTNGFVRGVMRGLAHERKMHGLGPDQPFRVSETSSHDVYLDDLATGRRIDLQSFGDTNRAAFSHLLKAGRTS